jgi:putative endonuclease
VKGELHERPRLLRLHARESPERYALHGVTNDVLRRTWEHKNNLVAGFTKKYGVHILVWYELHTDIHEAITREKQLKSWNRAWKIRLIEKRNSGWNDLYAKLLGEIALPELPGSPSLASHANAHDARRG